MTLKAVLPPQPLKPPSPVPAALRSVSEIASSVHANENRSFITRRPIIMRGVADPWPLASTLPRTLSARALTLADGESPLEPEHPVVSNAIANPIVIANTGQCPFALTLDSLAEQVSMSPRPMPMTGVSTHTAAPRQGNLRPMQCWGRNARARRSNGRRRRGGISPPVLLAGDGPHLFRSMYLRRLTGTRPSAAPVGLCG